MVDTLLLILYALIGVVMAIAGIEAFRAKDNPARIGTGLFWIIMAIVFAFGTLLPAMVVGILVVIIGILALFKQIQIGKIKPVDGAHAATGSQTTWRLGVCSKCCTGDRFNRRRPVYQVRRAGRDRHWRGGLIDCGDHHDQGPRQNGL